MSQTQFQTQPLGPVATHWWQRPIVAIATVVVVTGLTGGIAYAATRGEAGGTVENEVQFPGGGGQFPGGPMGQQGGQPGQQGQVPGGVPGQTSRGANSPTT